MENATTTEAPGAYEALRSAIAARYPELSKQLQKIARFALEYPDDLALETVASLAARAGVQPSSMVRFAQALGYDGFSNMQLVFRSRLVTDSNSYRDRIEALRRQHDSGGGDASNVLSGFVTEGMTSLELLRDHTPAAVLERAVELLAEADDIYLLAERRSFPLACYLAYALARLERRAHLLDGIGGMLAQQVAVVRNRDVLVAASFPPFSPQVAGAFVDCHQRGVPTIAITDSPVSPLALEATVAFHIKQQEEGSFRSLVAPMCLAQSLVVALGYHLASGKNGEPRR
jgi:DNA-binding MurR/RpiR family transcriptional regulator